MRASKSVDISEQDVIPRTACRIKNGTFSGNKPLRKT
jgi:hypothetical protein